MEPTLGCLEREVALEVLRLRCWQHLMNEQLKEKRFLIPIHCAFGHEAIAVAVNRMMRPADQLVLSHRNMAYNLAREGALSPILDEYLLRHAGVSRGRLGSMNLANSERGVVYSSSILGNNLSVACGLALSQVILGRPGVVTVLTGDGAMEEGSFWEALVFSKSHHLPLLIVVENNNQAMSSTIAERRCPIDTASLCASVGIPFHHLSGNNVLEYLSVLCGIRSIISEERVPACLEVEVRAFNQHAGPTPGWPGDVKSISIEKGLMLEESRDDPLLALRDHLGDDEFAALCRLVMAEAEELSIADLCRLF